MSQAYPQFTPVQILEAGQRAFSEGRTEYAAQFFKHLIDHYADTPEAAVARDAMGQVNGTAAQPASPQYAQPNGVHPAAASAHPAPGYAPSASTNGSLQGVQLSANGNAGAQANGHGQPGYAANGQTMNGLNGHANGLEANGYAPSQRGVGQQPAPMAQRAPLARPTDGMQMPQQQQRQAPAHQAQAMPGAAASENLSVPALEKNYIIGRVIAGLLLLIGILGIFAGIVLVYAAISDPAIFAKFGMTTQASAVIFSGSVFIGSIMALILAQVATALFDGADAVADLSRLERFRVGDTDDYDS